MEAPISNGKQALYRTPFLWPVFVYERCESWQIATPFLPGELTQEAVKSHVQFLGMLPVTTTWQHSRENDKTGSVITPYGPVQGLYLLLHCSKTFLPGWHSTPTPVIHAVGAQMEGYDSEAAHSDVPRDYSFCSILKCFSDQRVVRPQSVTGQCFAYGIRYHLDWLSIWESCEPTKCTPALMVSRHYLPPHISDHPPSPLF